MPELMWSEEGQSRLGDRAHPAGNRAPRLSLVARQIARQGGQCGLRLSFRVKAVPSPRSSRLL
jgi:hypothetical protein